MKQFIYKVFTYDNDPYSNNDDELEDELVGFGQLGWELVSALPVVKGAGTAGEVSVHTNSIKFIFKKEK